jgi:superfamily I DNA/RNA helicase
MRVPLDDLNQQQRLAVTTHSGPLLILAGAGSGKTRVITYRIASMLGAGIAQRSILALTFTNKAAREMAERVFALAGRRLRDLTISTYHSFGVSVLKRHAHRAGLRPNFSIYDTQDQISLLRETAHETGSRLDPGEASRILTLHSAVKTGRAPAESIPSAYRELLEHYARHMEVYNAVDFDDLIGRQERTNL